MATIGMLIGSAFINAISFSSSSFLFSKLSRGNHESEVKRHNEAVEKMNADKILWEKKKLERKYYLSGWRLSERMGEKKKNELMRSMREYYISVGQEPKNLLKLPPEPTLSDYYQPHPDRKSVV